MLPSLFFLPIGRFLRRFSCKSHASHPSWISWTEIGEMFALLSSSFGQYKIVYFCYSLLLRPLLCVTVGYITIHYFESCCEPGKSKTRMFSPPPNPPLPKWKYPNRHNTSLLKRVTNEALVSWHLWVCCQLLSVSSLSEYVAVTKQSVR